MNFCVSVWIKARKLYVSFLVDSLKLYTAKEGKCHIRTLHISNTTNVMRVTMFTSVVKPLPYSQFFVPTKHVPFLILLDCPASAKDLVFSMLHNHVQHL